MQLNVVLLPDPLGPIRPRMSPSLTSNDTLLTARSAPKRLVRPETLSIGILPSPREAVGRVGGRRRREPRRGERGVRGRAGGGGGGGGGAGNNPPPPAPPPPLATLVWGGESLDRASTT